MTNNKEKTTTKMTKTVLFATLTAAIAVSLTTTPFAFAAESFPTWGTNQANPNGTGCGGECKAKVNTSGINDVYAKSNSAFEARDAYAHNNSQWNPVVTTSALELNTNNALVGMQIDIVYDGSITAGFGSTADYHVGLDLYKKISGSYLKVSGCYDVLNDTDDLTDSQTLDCTASNSGTNDYRAGATHRANAYNTFGGVDAIVDFYDDGVGDDNKAETDRLEICAGAC